jgi:hypothetical protein
MKILRIKFSHQKDFNNYLKDENINLSVIAETSDLGEVNITNYYPNDSLNIFSLDNNFYIIPNSNDGEKIEILAKSEGSGIIKASFIYEGEVFYYSKQFICHGSFFKDNYMTYLIPGLDSYNLSKNQFVKSIFDTLMEMLDILYAYNEDLKMISSFKEGKSKFISLLAQNVGLERIDFTQINTKYEYVNDETFREIIGNIFDLLTVRGTKLAYELFFGALGYNTSIQEFWYDKNGDLIEINSDDESLSTFYAYNTDGTLLDNPPLPRDDPRKDNILFSNDYNDFGNYVRMTDTNGNILFSDENNNFGNYIRITDASGNISYQPKSGISFTPKTNSYDQNVFKNNKSNYIRVIFNSSYNDQYFENPLDFSPEKKLIIRRYLDFLRPSHIQYILESFNLDFGGGIGTGSNLINDIVGELTGTFSVSDLKEFPKPEDLYASGIIPPEVSQNINFTNSIVENIFELISNNEEFNVGDVLFYGEEFSFSNKWDFSLKFDDQIFYDFKDMLNEDLSYTTQ